MDSGFRRNDGFWTFDESIKLDELVKSRFCPFCHSVLDTESRDFNALQKHWTPVFTGVTTFDESIKLRFPD